MGLVTEGEKLHIVNWHCLPQEAVIRHLVPSTNGAQQSNGEKTIIAVWSNKIAGKQAQSFINFVVAIFRFDGCHLVRGDRYFFIMGEVIDALVIALIVVLNACLGAFQEYKAEEALKALEDYGPSKCLVTRKAIRLKLIKSCSSWRYSSFVSRYQVSADARLLTANSLQMDEAILTGESMPVSKRVTYFR